MPPSSEILIPSNQPLETVTLDITGMKCAGCVKAVEDQLKQFPGVVSACVNLVTEVAAVECEPGKVDPNRLAQVVTDVGFPSHARQPEGSIWDEEATLPTLAERRQAEKQQQTQQLAIALLLLCLSVLGHLNQLTALTIPGLSNIWFHCGLATLALLLPGRPMLIDGWRGLRRNAPNMNTLVSLGTVTAYTASLVALLVPQLGWECFFDEPVMLVGFILLGRTLEHRARGRAAAAFQALVALQPRVARLIKDPGEPNQVNQASVLATDSIEIPADRVRLGEWLQVLPGERIPVDGEVVAGQTTIDESMLTGEPLPILKQPGDFVAAGTLNQSGVIALRATRTGQETTLAHIIALVEAAQTRKAPVQQLADTVAGYFTYGVMAIATLTFLFWYFIGTNLWPDVLMSSGHWHIGGSHAMLHASMPHIAHPTPLLLSLRLAIAVLVVACPCTLGLATPTAILVGSGIGAERGLLIRGGDVLERVHHLNTIIFDKTGTLTTNCPTVTDCLPLPIESDEPATQPAYTPDGLLQLAATVESGTRHPLAEAIRQQAQQRDLSLLPARDFQTEAGQGISAIARLPITSAEQRILVGNADWLLRHHVPISLGANRHAQALAAAGKTPVYVAVAEALVGIIAVTTPLRTDARETVAALQQMGLRVMLLTGDRSVAAQAIAQSLGIVATDALADVRPEDKATQVAQLQAQNCQVGMVGDGINDAPALAQADVGIALRSGTDAAMETAQIILMRDRLMDVVESIRLSRATFNKIRQNLFWAFAYNLLGIPVAAGVLLPGFGISLSPAIAGAMMAFSSISVVTNSLLLRRSFPTHPLKESQSNFSRSEPLAGPNV